MCVGGVRHRAEHQLSKEERLKRRELLERYGYQIETTDEHGDIVLTENLCDVQDTAGAAPSLASALLGAQAVSPSLVFRCV